MMLLLWLLAQNTKRCSKGKCIKKSFLSSRSSFFVCSINNHNNNSYNNQNPVWQVINELYGKSKTLSLVSSPKLRLNWMRQIATRVYLNNVMEKHKTNLNGSQRIGKTRKRCEQFRRIVVSWFPIIVAKVLDGIGAPITVANRMMDGHLIIYQHTTNKTRITL